ncbi:unnamed protein product [Paramecium octaurelia]|uniref:Transmembrane protein n=1 Tax=Paramecium octaurelia TaxID=43137 RepID=A0A8S1V4C8_PAROT|nr:unnamed protein product [Paramecium octaurelia]
MYGIFGIKKKQYNNKFYFQAFGCFLVVLDFQQRSRLIVKCTNLVFKCSYNPVQQVQFGFNQNQHVSKMLRKELQLLIAVGGIYFCYFKVGLIQEDLFKSNFGTMDFPSPKFEFSSVLIFLQMLIYNLLCLVMILKNKVSFVCTIKEGAYLGLLNFSSMIGALTALQYVSFPLQALVKSCKYIFLIIIIESCLYWQSDWFWAIRNSQSSKYFVV